MPESVLCEGRKVVSMIVGREGEGRCKLVFGDGSERLADLVVGCDGIWSRARTAVLGYEVAPKYEGLTGVGGFVSSEKLVGVDDGLMNVVFGANGFFGYGYSSSDERDTRKPGKEAAWWSTYTLAECPKDWRRIDRDDAKRQLEERHRTWKNEVIQRILDDVQIENVYPTFTTPDLPTWEAGGCVLVGDSAHALQPSEYKSILFQSILNDSPKLTVTRQRPRRKHGPRRLRDPRSASRTLSELRRGRLAARHKGLLRHTHPATAVDPERSAEARRHEA